MATNHAELEKRLWAAADQLWANTGLKPSEFSVPVLGLIFLRYADHRFAHAERELAGAGTGRRKVGPTDYQARGVLFLPPRARFGHLLTLSEGEDLGKAINEAMRLIEEENDELRGVLPRTYTRLDNATLAELLKLMSSIPMDIEGDAFGKIYESGRSVLLEARTIWWTCRGSTSRPCGRDSQRRRGSAPSWSGCARS